MITSGNKPIESINSRHVKAQSSSVTVNWTWYDESQGIVSWNFQNNSNEQKSVILYRSGYYFGNAFWCFKPDEIILGDNKKAEDYKVGDKILGDRKLVTIKAIGRRKADKGLIKIKANGMLPLEVTPEHPILRVRNIHNNGGVKIIDFTDPEFVPAYELKEKHVNDVGDYLVLPILKGDIDIKKLDISHNSKNITKCKVTEIPLNEDVAWLLGLYAAEGYTGGKDKNQFGFALNEDETTTIEKLRKILSEIGFATHIAKRHGKGIVVVGSSRVFAKSLEEWLGYSAHNKHIPDFILFNKNKEILLSFLNGYVEGDGHIIDYDHRDKPSIGMATVSKILAEQLQLAYIRLGQFANISVWNGGEEIINGKKIHSGKQYRLRVSTDTVHSRAKFTENYVYVPIRKIEKENYEGDVIDFETEDHAITLCNAITHNCVYVNNGMTYWATSLTPLIDQGVANNTMPIGIIDFGGGNKIIAFIFTLAPGQKWSVLEGGFSSAMQPSGQAVYELSLEKTGSFCIGYDPQQVLDWDLQTGTTMQGYSPNPNNFNTIEVTVPVGTQYIQLFPNDTVSDSACPPQPNCLQEIEQGIEQGNIDLFLEGVMCVLEQMGYSFKTVLDKFWDKIVEELKKSV
ncbi:MAG: LAGLIDADG family homing endonuclease [Thermoplasmatales archaeon]